jgi:hypothetical protein
LSQSVRHTALTDVERVFRYDSSGVLAGSRDGVVAAAPARELKLGCKFLVRADGVGGDVTDLPSQSV